MSYYNGDPELQKIHEANQRKARDKRLEEAASDFLKMTDLFESIGFEGQYYYGIIAELVKTAQLKQLSATIERLDFNS